MPLEPRPPPLAETRGLPPRGGAADQCVHIGDRESDSYELSASATAKTQILVRTCVDRLAETSGSSFARNAESRRALMTSSARPRVSMRDHCTMGQFTSPMKPSIGIDSDPALSSPMPPKGDTRLIVVDDDMSMSQAIERLLAAAGWRVRSFADPEASCIGRVRRCRCPHL